MLYTDIFVYFSITTQHLNIKLYIPRAYQIDCSPTKEMFICFLCTRPIPISWALVYVFHLIHFKWSLKWVTDASGSQIWLQMSCNCLILEINHIMIPVLFFLSGVCVGASCLFDTFLFRFHQSHPCPHLFCFAV